MSEPVRAGLVGMGYWGANLARNLDAAEGVELVAVADGDAERRSLAARRYPRARIVGGLEELLDDPELDAVVVATPVSTHAAMARRVLSAGRHVFVEKPLATNEVDAEELVGLADEAGRVLMVGHTFLYAAPVLWLRDAIEQGELGQVQYVYSQRLNLGRIRSDCNALWNFGPHDVSIIHFLLDDRPVEVSATGFSFLQPGIEDVCFATLRFHSGAAASLHLSWIDPRKTRLMTVVGSEQMAVYDDVSADNKVWLYDAGALPVPGAPLDEFSSLGDFQWRTRAGDVRLPKIGMREPLLVEMEAFAEACRTGRSPRTDARQALDVVRVLCALDRSMAARGAPVGIEW